MLFKFKFKFQYMYNNCNRGSYRYIFPESFFRFMRKSHVSSP